MTLDLDDLGPLFGATVCKRVCCTEEAVDTPTWYAEMATWRGSRPTRWGTWRNPLTGRRVAVDLTTGKVRRP